MFAASLLALPAAAQDPPPRGEAAAGVASLPRPTLVAHALTAPIRLDGVLDEPAWQAEPTTGFIQAEPDEGLPATERTHLWVAHGDGNLYVAARLYDQQPDRLVVNDIRKDFDDRVQDAFAVILDTFHDRRNGYVFVTNPAGARADRQIANEGREINASWDAIWRVETARADDGWTVEMEIPFRSIRSAAAGDVWGINFSRRIRRNNEIAFWAPVPRSYGLTRLSLAGTLSGLPETRSAGRDLRFTPYALANTVRGTGGPSFDSELQGGFDVKWGLTRGLALDLTVNPDFAQVEADVQRVNLTQFSLFFPEKRRFFLENSDSSSWATRRGTPAATSCRAWTRISSPSSAGASASRRMGGRSRSTAARVSRATRPAFNSARWRCAPAMWRGCPAATSGSSAPAEICSGRPRSAES